MFRLLALLVGLGLLTRKAAAVTTARAFEVIATSEESQGGPLGTWLDSSEVWAALPHRGVLGRRIAVLWNGNIIEAEIRDVGPWNIDDDYWNTPAGVPRAELDPTRMFSKGYAQTNGAGLDLSEGAWEALGHPSPARAKERVVWRFV